MTKTELLRNISEWSGITQVEVGAIINRFVMLIGDALVDEGRFAYPRLGIFKKRRSAACSRPNPQNRMEKIHTPARNTVKFRPAPALKALIQ